MSEQIEPISIFYSYAHKDEAIRDQLGKHLSGLEQQGLIVGWHDRCISLGTPWADEISTHLKTAGIILLLISPDFINSGYCMGIELKEAMRLHEEGKARVIPIHVRSANCDGLIFSKIQWLPRDGKPVMEVAKRDRVLAQIAKEIRNIVTELNSTKEQSQTKELAKGYTEEQLEKDIAVYTTHLTETLRRLKISGVIPKDRGDKNEDPELHGIFVPLRAIVQPRTATRQPMPSGFEDKPSSEEKQQYPIVPLLEQHSYVVLLGGPGSGKSTVMRHLAWSHASTCRGDGTTTNVPLLTGKLIPLRIELRRLSDDRKYRFNYNFLSYTLEVLERNNIKINPHMFEECLKQKRMLLLFDGLDEVATLDERKRLVEEIEHFALRYPGNHVVVTSRPVGYELASCSRQIFVHANVQSFDDEQINAFLVRWYTYVLQLSPIPYEEQQELEALTRTLKENTRLHKLAENPLLLTVIAALYRSTRLPDKRVQVYDKCAELLLETWAKLKGTDIRWKEMRMVKEDQYACVAHLGYILHQRVQQNQKDGKRNNDSAVDVPARFIQKEIETFLASKKLITEVAEQRLEARRFLDLVRVEAGLIVERGTDEKNEPLYGFVHRTFQEYFAAVDVYERYQQEEDPTIITEFLQEHLYNSHWREVILLLLGKLKSKPVTNQLRKILNGEIKNAYSQYAELIEYNLFFVSQCLIEEISVEIDLAEKVVSRLGDLVRHTQVDLLRTNALDNLNKLIQTRQYATLSSKELLRLLKEDLSVHRDVASILLRNSANGSEEKIAATEALLELMQSSYSVAIPAAKALYEASSDNSEERKQASQFLLQLIQRSDSSVEKSIRAAKALCEACPVGSEEREQGEQFLLELMRRADIPVKESIQAAEAVREVSSVGSEERMETLQFLLQLMQRSDISFEQTIQVIDAMVRRVSKGKEGEQIVEALLALMQRPDLSVEQVIQVARSMRYNVPLSNEQREHAMRILLRLIQSPDLSIEQVIEVAEATRGVSSYEMRTPAIQILQRLMQRSDLSIEQVIQLNGSLFNISIKNGRQTILSTLEQIGQNKDIDSILRLKALASILMYEDSHYEEKVRAMHMLLGLNQKEAVLRYLKDKWRVIVLSEDTTDIPFLAELANQEMLPLWVRDSMYEQLHNLLS